MIAIVLLKLIFSLILTLFLPGYFLLRLLLGSRDKSLAGLEQLVLSFGLSLFAVDFLFIGLYLLHVPINQVFSILAIIFFCSLCFMAEKFFQRKAIDTSLPPETGRFSFLENTTSWQKMTFILIFLLAALIRTLYVAQGSIPQTTDLGHHMYWAKSIVTTGQLPDYGMPDFIIGEHIVFGVMGAISQIDFVSGMPVALLLLINLVSVLALALLGYRMAQLIFKQEAAFKVALLVLLTGGVLYAISSPQAKFVSGGVIGNVMGNLLMPLMIYCFASAIYHLESTSQTAKPNLSKFYFFLFILFSATLAYTHHLTTFVFMFTFAGFLMGAFVVYLFISRFNLKALSAVLGLYIRNLFSFKSLLFILAFAMLAIFIYPPSYLNKSAIDTAVGTPIKETRIGMNFIALTLTAGPWRFFYAWIAVAILGILIARILFEKDNGFRNNNFELAGDNIRKIVGATLSAVWFVVLFIMSNKPALLKIDIPSNRVASYLALPVSVLSAMAVYYLLTVSTTKLKKTSGTLFFMAVLGTAIISGLGDVSDSARQEVNVRSARQVYDASKYLHEKTAAKDIILKDHIYLTADSWIKLFLMRDYKNPLSRSLLKRYEDIARDRETCTRDMVAIPDSETGRKCFEETKTKYVMLKPGYDTAQFDDSADFAKIYSSEDVVIYQRY